MIDGATWEGEKVTPVYKLEEICELLSSSHVSVVKEVSEFTLNVCRTNPPSSNRRFWFFWVLNKMVVGSII